MLKLTRFDGTPVVINVDQIEYVEETPDTVISLVSARKVLVRESADRIIEMTVEFKKKILRER